MACAASRATPSGSPASQPVSVAAWGTTVAAVPARRDAASASSAADGSTRSIRRHVGGTDPAVTRPSPQPMSASATVPRPRCQAANPAMVDAYSAVLPPPEMKAANARGSS